MALFKKRNIELEGFAALRGWQKTGKKPLGKHVFKEVYGVYAPKFSKKRGVKTVKSFYGKKRSLWLRFAREATVATYLAKLRNVAPYPHEVYAIVYGGYAYTDVFYHNYSVAVTKDQYESN